MIEVGPIVVEPRAIPFLPEAQPVPFERPREVRDDSQAPTRVTPINGSEGAGPRFTSDTFVSLLEVDDGVSDPEAAARQEQEERRVADRVRDDQLQDAVNRGEIEDDVPPQLQLRPDDVPSLDQELRLAEQRQFLSNLAVAQGVGPQTSALELAIDLSI